MKNALTIVCLLLIPIVGLAWAWQSHRAKMNELDATLRLTGQKLERAADIREGRDPLDRLATCGPCGAKISPRAQACPRCGDPR
jgi:hypothetical protein